MKFSIGDKVVLKQTDEEGVIVAYISEDMVEVDVDGTTFPVHIDEVEHPYLKWFTQKKKPLPAKRKAPEDFPVEKAQQRQQRMAKGIYLSFLPVFKMEEMEDVVDYLKVHLVNELPKEIQFQYDYVLFGETEFKHEGKLQGFGNLYLHKVPFDDMNDQPRFNWKVDDLEDSDMAPAEGQLRIRPQKVFQHINNILSNNEPSFSYMLLEEFMPNTKFVAKEPAKKIYVPKEEPKSKPEPSAQYEIDLHIEKLTDSMRGMTNADIIQLQLSTLETYLRLAINNYQDHMVIIHGLGKGKLRDEVHRILSATPEVDTYANEWHGRYGFGATEVKFKY